MGWREAKEEADRARKEASDLNKEFLGRRSSLGGKGSSGSGMSSIIKGTSDTEKLPKEQFERDFLMAIDKSMLDLQSLGQVFDHFSKSGISSTRFRGINKDGIINHLSSVLKQYRPDVHSFLQEQIKGYMGGK